jgi:hypothetical protein
VAPARTRCSRALAIARKNGRAVVTDPFRLIGPGRSRRIRLYLLPYLGGRRLASISTADVVSECDLVEAAKKLNALQPVPTASNRDGHNPGTVEPDRGPRLKVSL